MKIPSFSFRKNKTKHLTFLDSEAHRQPGADLAPTATLQNPFQNEALSLQDQEIAGPEYYTSEQEAEQAEMKSSASKPDMKQLAADFKPKIKQAASKLNGLLGEPYSLIAFQTGSFGLHGALISNGRHEASIRGFATSSSVDFTRAITEVLEQLKAEHKRLPKKVILLSPSVVSDLVQLPVSPLRPRTNEQMQELIRWELESVVSQQNIQWKTGSILIERGRMTHTQRDHVLEELDIRQAQGGAKSLVRFGDLAVELAYIEREHLEECFSLQGKLVALDDELEYGWQASETPGKAPSDEVLLSQEDDSDSSHPWLVSGMSKSVRRRWLGAFKLNGLSLEAFYPSVSAAFASLAQRGEQSGEEGEITTKQLLLEVYQEQIALISGSKGVVNSIKTQVRQVGQLSASECCELLGGQHFGVKRLYIASNGIEDIQCLMPVLSKQLNIEVELLSGPLITFELPESVHSDVLQGIHGVSNHFLGHMPLKCLSRVSSSEIKQQVWKEHFTTKNMAILVGVLVFISMFGFLGWMEWNTRVQAERLAELSAKYDGELAIQQQLRSSVSDSRDMQRKIKRAGDELEGLKRTLVTMKANAGYRQLTPQALLKVFVLALEPSITILKITKTNEEGDDYILKAGASSNLSGQEFISRIDMLAKPLRYQVVDSLVASGKVGKGGNVTYSVTMTLSYNAGLSKVFELASAKQ